MNKFDGRLSICHVFSFRELATAAVEAGWSGFGHRRFPVNPQAIWPEGEALNPVCKNHTLEEATSFHAAAHERPHNSLRLNFVGGAEG